MNEKMRTTAEKEIVNKRAKVTSLIWQYVGNIKN